MTVPDYASVPMAPSHLVVASRAAAPAITTKPDPALERHEHDRRGDIPYRRGDRESFVRARTQGRGQTASMYPLKDRAAGEYVLRVEAKRRTGDGSAVSRDMPFSVDGTETTS